MKSVDEAEREARRQVAIVEEALKAADDVIMKRASGFQEILLLTSMVAVSVAMKVNAGLMVQVLTGEKPKTQ